MLMTELPVQRLFVVGAGNRGTTYAQYALENPDLCRVVGVAEKRPIVRERIRQKYEIVQEMVFSDWKDAVVYLRDRRDMVDAVVIALQDADHRESCLAFADLGVHILLEKPMALSVKDCQDIVEAVEHKECMLAVCHVLRYTQTTQRVKEMIDSGLIGDIVNIQHLEPVGWFHFAHSYARGNWRNEKMSTFALLAKSCHDLDWILHINRQSKPKFVTSFGSLMHMNQRNKPADAADKCLDCPAHVERQCPYSAKAIYLDPLVETGESEWAHHIVKSGDVPDIENVTDALQNTNYGQCVYSSDNDVVDNQIVNIEFENGSTCSFTMVAYSQDVCVRKTRIFGTRGQIDIDGNVVKHFDFVTKNLQMEDFGDEKKHAELRHTRLTNHGFADYFLMKAFVKALATRDPSVLLSSARETLESHMLVFCAEEARKQRKIIDFQQWLARQEQHPKN